MRASLESNARRNRPASRRFRHLLAEPLEPRTLLTLTPELVTDLNAKPQDIAVCVYQMVTVSDSAYFRVCDANLGYGLWKSDGTTAGTSLVKDNPILAFAPFQGSLLFTTTTGGLWKTDGTAAGTTHLSSVTPILVSNPPVEINGTMFFVVGTALWKTDGTPDGTRLVKDFAAAPTDHTKHISNLTNFNGILFFVALDGDRGVNVWKSDGTAAGTTLTDDMQLGETLYNDEALRTVNGRLFLFERGPNGTRLWTWDSPTASPEYVTDLPGFQTHPTAVGGTLFFYLGSATAKALWKSDGSAAGTVPVKLGYAGDLTAIGNTLLFSDRENLLWRSDGTEAGTFPLTSGPTNFPVKSLHFWPQINGYQYFTRSVNSVNTLWGTDGTLAGTAPFVGSEGNGNADSAESATPSNGRYFFLGDEVQTNQSALWTSDGTVAGTHPVHAFGPSADSLSTLQSESAIIGDVSYFAATDGVHGTELWRSDGTEARTYMVRDIVAGNGGSRPSDFAALNGVLYFLAYDSTGKQSLWTSDGTSDGTRIVHDFPQSVSLFSLQSVNNKLVFMARFPHVTTDDDPWSGIWTSDGTAAGTTRISDAVGQYLSFTRGANGLLYYSAWNYAECSDSTNCWDVEPWRVDGTVAGTYQLQEIMPPDDSALDTRDFMAAGSTEFFFTYYSVLSKKGIALWKTDGTSQGTLLVTDFSPGSFGDVSGSPLPTQFDQTLFFVRSSDSGGAELWKSDRTPAGTGLVKGLAGISFGSGNTNVIQTGPYPAIRGNGRIFFWGNDGSTGWELWTSDGTPAGTTLVKDIHSGADGSSSGPLVTINGAAFFVIDDGIHGRELWRSDGTAAGTSEITDIAPGPASSSPAFLWDDERGGPSMPVLLSADDGKYGRELWKLVDINAAPTFQPGPDVATLDTSALNIIDNWATLIAAGPPDEIGQHLHFVVENDNPGLFAVQPSIDALGRLQFATIKNILGTADVTVVLIDDGGSANGGIDHSAPLTFTINVALDAPLHNYLLPPDVTADGQVVAEDVIDLINYINARGSGPANSEIIRAKLLQSSSEQPTLYYDVIGDNYIAPDDVITIVNYINARPRTPAQAEQDSSASALQNSSSPAFNDADSLLLLLAADIAQEQRKR